MFFKYQNKKDFLIDYLSKKKGNIDEVLDGFIFLGNDLNDLEDIDLAGFAIATLDCHPIIKNNVYLIIHKK